MADADRLLAAAKDGAFYEKTTDYLQSHLHAFLRRQERVLLCCTNPGPFSMAALAEKAVRRAQAIPLRWGPDYRWQALLKQAFSSHATAMIGQPLVVLGLTKLARFTGTPLFIRNVVVGGDPCETWMLEGIQNGLDAEIFGCYDPEPGVVLAGFSCKARSGVHIRTDAYTAEVVGPSGNPLPEGTLGEIVLSCVGDPSARCATGHMGRLESGVCPCGNHTPRLTDFRGEKNADPALSALQERLLSWTSILDYRAARTEAGLELEIVRFPGQRLPELPNCAKLVVRDWNPKQDMPFCLQTKKSGIFPEIS